MHACMWRLTDQYAVLYTGDRATHACIEKTSFRDRKSTRLNSSHLVISYAVFCLKKKKHLTVDDLLHTAMTPPVIPTHSAIARSGEQPQPLATACALHDSEAQDKHDATRRCSRTD